MADALIAPASGRTILRLPARTDSRPSAPVADYCRARERAAVNAARRALRRAARMSREG